ncbi:toll/interleukin-1 receptor domain-containing protein [Mesorhizobium sp. M0976]|uniref:hypothetical protein n=1 Tax=Mesorhizobium sp. M0976 TaxID=2957038 RepID=UPI00333A4371
MKIFASWSGKQSRKVAEALKSWLPNVLQTADVFISSENIASGDRGLNRIADNLSERGFGIVVLTKSNFEAPWVLFEAGALSNTKPGRVATLLCDMPELALVKSPLSQFQHNKFEKEGIRKLVKDVNSASETPIDDGRLQAAFEKWWPDLEEQYRSIPVDDEASMKSPMTKETNVEAALARIIAELQQQQTNSLVTHSMLANVVSELKTPSVNFLRDIVPGGIPGRLRRVMVDDLAAVEQREALKNAKQKSSESD